MIERFELSNAEKDSAIWKKLKAHLESRLDTMRKQNDHDLSPDDTSRQRGKIALCKEILGLDRDELN